MKKSVVWLTESAICVAISVVLSFISVIKMPFGGSVTPASMLPMIIVCYRYGFKKGLLSGFVFAVIQLITDIGVLSFATSPLAVVTIIFLDYLFAFSSVAIAGLFKNRVKKQKQGIIAAILLIMLIRFICHIISGCTVWAGVSIPTADGFIYSLIYNSAFMLPETILLLAVGSYIFGIIDFSGQNLKRLKSSDSTLSIILNAAFYVVITLAAIFDAVKFFTLIETKNGFSARYLTLGNFYGIIIVSAAALIIAIILRILAKRTDNPSKYTK